MGWLMSVLFPAACNVWDWNRLKVRATLLPLAFFLPAVCQSNISALRYSSHSLFLTKEIIKIVGILLVWPNNGWNFVQITWIQWLNSCNPDQCTSQPPKYQVGETSRTKKYSWRRGNCTSSDHHQAFINWDCSFFLKCPHFFNKLTENGMPWGCIYSSCFADPKVKHIYYTWSS